VDIIENAYNQTHFLPTGRHNIFKMANSTALFLDRVLRQKVFVCISAGL